jgi:hypothetical protein
LGLRVDELPVLSFVRDQEETCRYKPLRSLPMISQQGMDENSNATVLMEDDLPLDTFPSTGDNKDRKVVLVGGENWITGRAISRDKIFRFINFHALKHAAESDTTKAIVNWRLQVDLEDTLSAEWVNKMMMTAKDTVTAMVCIAALKEWGGGGPDYECSQL